MNRRLNRLSASADCQELATRIRRHVLEMTHRARSSHVGSSLSMADILAVLYGRVLRIKPEDPRWPERDRFILSKGHGAAAVYAALAERGFFSVKELETFYQNGSALAGHITHTGVAGVEASTGSLGHGLAMGCGMALAGKRDACDYRVFVMLSDGECDEGSTWESALFAPHHQLDNLVVIIDYNKIQSLDRVEHTLALEPFREKWKAFGWSVHEIDGHDLGEIEATLSAVPFEKARPSCVIAQTTKGKGVSFMEDSVFWHYQSPNTEELHRALQELEGLA
jgi:transketolase